MLLLKGRVFFTIEKLENRVEMQKLCSVYGKSESMSVITLPIEIRLLAEAFECLPWSSIPSP